MADTTVAAESRTPAELEAASPTVSTAAPDYVIARPWGYEPIKSVMDLVGAAVSLVIALPICAVLAILIKLDNRGPVLFRQRRPGKHHEPFEILKFRTMINGAEERLAEVIDINDTDDPLIRVADDPRLTRVGRLLRRTSLDELPQLVNVLKGDMGLVGPRPISRPIHDPRDRIRLQVKPGITGLWQISGRKSQNTDFMLRKDMEYLRRRSLWFDLGILIRTLGAVLRADGAR